MFGGTNLTVMNIIIRIPNEPAKMLVLFAFVPSYSLNSNMRNYLVQLNA